MVATAEIQERSECLAELVKRHAGVYRWHWTEDRIVVLLDETDDAFTVNGRKTVILKPDSVKSAEKPSAGTIIATGPGRLDPDTNRETLRKEMAAGARIIMLRHAGTDVEFDGTKYKVIRPDDVVATEA